MMHVDLTIMTLYMVTVVTIIAIPGPVVALVTGAGLTGGSKWAFRTIFGADAASLVLILLSVLIIKGLFAVNDTAFNALKLSGACYIAYIGWGILHSKVGFTQHEPAPIQSQMGGFSKGFLISISNPKDIIFFVSFFPQFLSITADTDASIALLTVLWIILDFATLMLVYLLIKKAMKPAARQLILTTSGAFMLLIALAGIVTSAMEMAGAQL